MELIYLWVEEYKNIKKQGFNFSPRFKCEYDEENKKLEIIDKEKTGEYYPKNFFGENINITAIVGENGSGKSSLLNAITDKETMIYKNKKFYSKLKCKIKNQSVVPLDFDNEISVVHANSDLMKINHIKDAWDAYRMNMYDENIYILKDESPIFSGIINIKAFEIRIINLINKHLKSFQNNLFSFNPTTLKLAFPTFIIPVDHIKKIYSEKEKKFIYKIAQEIKDIRDYSNNIYEKLLAYLFTRMAFSNDKLSKEFIEIKSIKNIENLIIEKFSTILKKKDISQIKILFKFLEEKDVFDSNFIIDNFFTDLENIKCKEIFFKLIEIDFLRINFLDKEKNTINYFDLSQGERTFFNESLMIFDKIIKTNKDDILIALDEPDLSLHPDWQKKYINELLKLLSNFPKKRFHVIITSHSPFLLSDLPKENVIFLEKGKQVCPFEDNQQTFGANIHTLLSHGFFMKDGLMGEFAKSKIDDVIKYLNNGKNTTISSDKDAQNIINIIGEPIIKRELQRMLKNKMELSNKEEIDKIREKVDTLTKELEESSKRLEELENKDKK